MITGYHNNSRGVGIRSYQLILPSVVCSTHLAKKVAEKVGAVTFGHQHGCGIIGPDVSGVNEFFVALAGHPNVQSTVVLGLGCETLQGNEVTESIASAYPETAYVVIQESAGMAGALESSISTARALQTQAPRSELATLTIGIEGSPTKDQVDKLIRSIESKGFTYVLANQYKEPSRNFPDLVRSKCHVIISFPDSNQPPTGYPLIPVITVANQHSPLHQALLSEFDCDGQMNSDQLLRTVIEIANGQPSKSEAKKIGDIVVPRLVRSV